MRQIHPRTDQRRSRGPLDPLIPQQHQQREGQARSTRVAGEDNVRRGDGGVRGGGRGTDEEKVRGEEVLEGAGEGVLGR